MSLLRRDVLKLGALGVAGVACTGGHSFSTVDAASASARPVAPAPPLAERALVGPKPHAFTLAFGSCNRVDRPQPLWAWIRAQRPDVWMWLGDIVYADTENVARTRELYRKQSERPEYRALVAETRVIGVWDDHDFGRNNVGREYEKRIESQAALLDFLDEPDDSPRRTRLGTYTSYEFGANDERVKVILLDGRYHRELPGPNADTLGAEQWKWLAAELASAPGALTVIASSYQVLPEQHPNEKWSNFPQAKARLFELLRGSERPGLVLVSGDRHFAELSRADDTGIGYPLFELTSSGLTHSYVNHREPNRYRVGKLYSHKNFGVVRVEWERRELVLEVRGTGGAVPIALRVPLAVLHRAG